MMPGRRDASWTWAAGRRQCAPSAAAGAAGLGPGYRAASPVACGSSGRDRGIAVSGGRCLRGPASAGQRDGHDFVRMRAVRSAGRSGPCCGRHGASCGRAACWRAVTCTGAGKIASLCRSPPAARPGPAPVRAGRRCAKRRASPSGISRMPARPWPVWPRRWSGMATGRACGNGACAVPAAAERRPGPVMRSGSRKKEEGCIP